eukprot:TRINITY_DN4984_c0_g1_i2.p2 TRINITY_DN4984_c0_g1~~TRINITY_DN4984_c0_g1_i2.p2  ORF type:complete len:106 (-),score=44.29 TRINITY_DN4984_c0_g1_i2:219-536(-)
MEVLYRGKGLGRILLNYAIQKVRENNKEIQSKAEEAENLEVEKEETKDETDQKEEKKKEILPTTKLEAIVYKVHKEAINLYQSVGFKSFEPSGRNDKDHFLRLEI